MLESLLSSRVRAKLLTIFMLSPGEEFTSWTLADLLHENYSAIWKELVHLENMRILSSEHKGRSKLYRIDPECSILPELRSIVLKTEGVGEIIQQRLSAMGSVKTAFIYGSYASGEADLHSDLDLMVIGKVDLVQFGSLITDLERELKRLINYAIYSEEEWNQKIAAEDHFIISVIKSPKVILIGDNHAI